jgi:APA family basic amino acid/polyamine antiporter
VSHSNATPSLTRGLTLIPTASIIIAVVIGTGVFVKARVMTCNVGEPGLVLGVYALAGVLTLFGALAYAELATMMPRAGGAYNYLGAAFGRRWAFLYGWMETFIGNGAGLAAIAILFVVFLNDLVGGALAPWAVRLLPLAVLGVVVVLNLASVRASGRVATALTVAKVALVLGIGVGAFMLGGGSWGHFAESGAASACADVPASARFGVAGFGAAMIGALWSYNGWQYMVGVAGEVTRPAKTLPLALVGATVLIAVLYVFVNAAYFYMLAPEAVAGVSPASSVAYEVAVRFAGAGVASVMAAGLVLSSFGTLHTSVLATSRIPFAMARDGLLPAPLAQVSPSTRVPRNAVILIGVLGVLFAASGTFDILSDLFVFAMLLFQALTVGALFVLRRRRPEVERPYRMWGYPVVPALYLLAVGFLLVNTLFATPGRALAGLGLIALGLPVYAYYNRRLPPDDPADWLGEAPEAKAIPDPAPAEPALV